VAHQHWRTNAAKGDSLCEGCKDAPEDARALVRTALMQLQGGKLGHRSASLLMERRAMHVATQQPCYE